MSILGFDTSTPASAVCVLHDDGRAFELEPAAEALEAPPAHGRELLPAIHRCMAEAGLDYGDLEAVAVGVGPGGFTGLRIGVSTARAISYAAGLELRRVSSLAALAHGLESAVRLPLIDARRGELYAALYEGSTARISAFVAAPEEVAARVQGPGLDPMAAGNGSLRFRDLLEAAGVRVASAGSRAHVVRGLSVCRLGLHSPAASSGAVLPDYLRPPDAKPL